MVKAHQHRRGKGGVERLGGPSWSLVGRGGGATVRITKWLIDTHLTAFV